MKVRVNRNNIWAKIFIDQLAYIGVRYACISPGSRSTPLTYTLSRNRKIKSFIHFDERSSAFLALGIAKSTNKPVIVVTTSGTAVVELYPAIVEAYQQRVPLIICTADRPPELIGSGANQTINQHNIFKNHIQWFRDLGLPSLNESGLHYLQKVAIKAFQKSLIENSGPVHLNFPFRKPLEPFTVTDEINKKVIDIKPQKLFQNKSDKVSLKSRIINKITLELVNHKKGIIIVGPMNYNSDLMISIKKLSTLLKYPILADGLSQLRFGVTIKDKNVLCNYSSFLQSNCFVDKNNPEIILQFGRTPTSSTLERFLSETTADRYLINHFGDKFDPSGKSKKILSLHPKDFCENLISELKFIKINRRKSRWQYNFIKAETTSEELKIKRIENSKSLNEPSIISTVIKFLPSRSNIFIGNSLPVRDLDYFFSNTSKKIVVHFNRGASGIDGVTSTALGIAIKRKPSVLITGDLSFLHDLGALSLASKYSIPLLIIVINNNGGGIFQSLPIANRINRFNEYFITPHNLELSKIVKSFGVNYQLIDSRSNLKSTILKNLKKTSATVVEIQTDAGKSVELRNKYSMEVKRILNKEFEK